MRQTLVPVTTNLNSFRFNCWHVYTQLSGGLINQIPTFSLTVGGWPYNYVNKIYGWVCTDCALCNFSSNQPSHKMVFGHYSWSFKLNEWILKLLFNASAFSLHFFPRILSWWWYGFAALKCDIFPYGDFNLIEQQREKEGGNA